MGGQCIRHSRSNVIIGIGLAAMLTMGGCDSTGPDASARDEFVHHVLDAQDDADLHIVSTDGARSRQLTNEPGQEVYPAVSPDGGRVAFTSDREGNFELYVVNVDGSGLVRLTDHPGVDTDPEWSPDGQRIIFASNRDAGEWELYTVGVNGAGLARLTTNTVLDLAPHWSPDGTKIAVSRDRDDRPGEVDVYVLNSDASNPVRLTETRRQEFRPRWSPDGRRIAFIADTVVAFTSGGVVLWALAMIDANGANREQLTTFSSAATQGFTWSRDGTRIIFDRNDDLWTIDVRSKNVTQLTNTPSVEEAAPSLRRVP